VLHNAHKKVEQSVPDDEIEKIKLLLVDDSPVERLALGHVLRDSGYAVDEIGDGATALTHIKEHEIDALLLDLQMPGVDGFDVLTYLQEHRRGLPVILLSGMPLHQIQGKVSALPSHELPPLLLKPIDPTQLLGVLELQLAGGLTWNQPQANSQDSAGTK
jgi:CheY-like chemotaxis protein